MGATYGRNMRMTIFGESHGKGIGLVLDGLPPGTPIDEAFIKEEMARRAPGQNLMSTQRQEKDAFIIESGVFEGRAAGTPVCVLIPNSDQHSKDYSILKNQMRPGHADYAGKIRYQGFNDYRGGGHFSGRLTAPLVFTGAVAKTILAKKGIIVGAHIARIGQVTDSLFNPLGETEACLR
ncbi:MAG: chorismate synthase, partial [Acidaminococcaceae bacterium]|nr:chorismate synthase [Acidaminococcaceae bacterium]